MPMPLLAPVTTAVPRPIAQAYSRFSSRLLRKLVEKRRNTGRNATNIGCTGDCCFFSIHRFLVDRLSAENPWTTRVFGLFATLPYNPGSLSLVALKCARGTV